MTEQWFYRIAAGVLFVALILVMGWALSKKSDKSDLHP